jgi:hypothetical protein
MPSGNRGCLAVLRDRKNRNIQGGFQRPALDRRIHVQITTGSADQVVNKSWMQLHELDSKFPVQASEKSKFPAQAPSNDQARSQTNAIQL